MTLSEFVIAWKTLAPVVRGKCFYCGEQTSKDGKPGHTHFQTKDHVIPLSVGGKAVCNKVICCWWCNRTKDDLTMQEFKLRSGIETFYAEEYLGVRIDDLSDIAEVTLHVMNARRVERRSIKFNGKPKPRIHPPDINELPVPR